MRFFDEQKLREFDSLLADIEHQAQDNADLVAKLAKYSMPLSGDLSNILTTDPQSDAYIGQIKSLHEEIIGKPHSSSMEGLPVLNADYERDWPYPWGTKSARTVAKFLISYGFLLKTADLPPSARVLEVGCGMGSLTWNLARMGYRVDALDPNEEQCEIVRKATKDFPAAPNVIAMTLDQWLDAKTSSYKYDAVIFFESFHHIMDHQACVEKLLTSHMEFDAKLLLAAEPIFEKQCDLLPYPWGPRLDGESLRAMRRWGWLELGYTRQYIQSLFDRFGLSLDWARCEEALPHSQIIVGFNANNHVNKTQDHNGRYPGKLADGIDLSIDSMPGYIAKFDGLTEAEPWGRWSLGNRVRLELTRKLPERFKLRLELTSVFGPNVRKNLKVHAGDQTVTQILEPIESRQSYEFEFSGVNSNEIELIIPHPCRPKDLPELGIEDPRRIGIGIKSIRITPLCEDRSRNWY